MLAAGVIVLCIASIIRAWGLLNYKRGPGAAARIASGPVLAIVPTFTPLNGREESKEFRLTIGGDSLKTTIE